MSLGPVDTNALHVRGGEALLASMDAIVTLEEPGGICFFSSAARQMFGWQEHEAWGKPFDFLVREEAATPRRERGLCEPEACCRRIGQHRDGSTFPACVLFSSHPAGSRVRTVIIRDLSRRDALERELAHTQKLAAVGLLAASVVHDFNNALTALRAHLHVAQLSGSVEPVTQCHAILDQCSGLTRWLLDFCSPLRAPRAVVQSTDLVQCVSEALGIVRRLLPKNVLIQVCHDTASAEVQVEPGLIEHALVNLILNARDAIAGGGTISVGVRSADSRHQLVVEDTGTGIAPDILGRVFEPFFSTKRTGQGTGLGLASVRRMVESAFGAVAIRSEPGRGTRVTLEFPRVPSEDASPRQRGGESHGMGRDDRSSMAPPAELR